MLAIVLLAAVVMTGWVALDAARHGRNWLAWAMLTAFTGVIGLSIWLAARRRDSATATQLTFPRAAGIALTAIPLLFLSAATTVFIVTFLFQVGRVEGGAMAPTLADGDRVIVNKWAYQRAEPRIGDIVMLHYPLRPESVFVMRVIAEQGDQVRIVKGRTYRNAVAMQEPFVAAEYRSADNWGPQVVPEGYCFVMGDRRERSSDSRHWGFVPIKYVVGRVAFRWWPLAEIRSF